MSRQKIIKIICIALVLSGVNLSSALGASETPTCVPQPQILELIEQIPKVFPISTKDNIYIIENNSNGQLTVTIDDLKLRFFDSRDSDPLNWWTVSNKFSENAAEQDLKIIGCVVAGLNNYETGKVDESKGAVERAQKIFNEYVSLIQSLLKK